MSILFLCALILIIQFIIGLKYNQLSDYYILITYVSNF